MYVEIVNAWTGQRSSIRAAPPPPLNKWDNVRGKRLNPARRIKIGTHAASETLPFQTTSILRLILIESRSHSAML